MAQHIHEAVREMIRALRALPDFSRSPTSSHSQPQAFLASKRCRPTYREKPANVRALGPLAALPRAPHVQATPAQCYQSPRKQEESATAHFSPFRARHCSSVSSMDVKTEQCSAAARRMQEKEVLGYMTMSPQVCHSSSALPQDEYMTMVSPHKHERPSSSSLQTSFNR